MKILHVAPVNVAGVPYSMMQMQNSFGHHSRLVSLHTNTLTFPEDICLDLPLPRTMLAQRWRDFKREALQRRISKQGLDPNRFLPTYRPSNPFERFYFWLDDRRRERPILQAIENHGLDDFDIVHYDGGVDFFRDARLAKRWKAEGKRIVCHYMGSDLRVRGINPVLDELSDLNITNETDHLFRHPDIHYIAIPFDCSGYRVRQTENERIRIVHSPSNRTLKGTDFILPVIERIKSMRPIEFVLLEHIPHQQVIDVKTTCDIAIDQIGNRGGTGYGRNSLETLAMGIPTVTDATPDHLASLPDHPFILANENTLFDRLIDLIDHPALRRENGLKGRQWVERNHSFEAVNVRLTALYRDHGIL